MRKQLPLALLMIGLIVFSGCSTSHLFTQKKSAPSEGAMAFEPQKQEVPQMSQERSKGLTEEKVRDFSKKANPLRVMKKMKDFTKTIASSAFEKLEPKRNTASDKSAWDVTLGQILIVVLIIALLAVLVGGGLGQVIDLLVSILIVILLVLLILWLLGSI